jgi:AGCS family alanine or glycine:cation symporter
MIAWSYYGDRSAYYLFGERAVMPYRVLFTVLVVVGAAVPLQLVWNIADITNILMAVPNLLGLMLLAGLVRKMQLAYFSDPLTRIKATME